MWCLPLLHRCSHPAPLSHPGVIRAMVLLLTLLGTWFLMQSYFQRSWRAVSLRSWLGEARRPRREGGTGSM